MRPIAFFDVDGVLVRVRSSWEHVHRALGVEEEARRIRRMFEEGAIDYVDWMRLDTELWIRARGGRLHYSELKVILDEVEIVEEAYEAFRRIRRAGAMIALVSSGIDILVRRVASELGADAWAANRLLFDEKGYLKPGGAPLVGVDKSGAVRRISWELGSHPSRAAYVGDSRWDASAMRVVGLPIAYGDDPELGGVAAVRVSSLLEAAEVIERWVRRGSL